MHVHSTAGGDRSSGLQPAWQRLCDALIADSSRPEDAFSAQGSAAAAVKDFLGYDSYKALCQTLFATGGVPTGVWYRTDAAAGPQGLLVLVTAAQRGVYAAFAVQPDGHAQRGLPLWRSDLTHTGRAFRALVTAIAALLAPSAAFAAVPATLLGMYTTGCAMRRGWWLWYSEVASCPTPQSVVRGVLCTEQLLAPRRVAAGHPYTQMLYTMMKKRNALVVPSARHHGVDSQACSDSGSDSDDVNVPDSSAVPGVFGAPVDVVRPRSMCLRHTRCLAAVCCALCTCACVLVEGL